MIDFFEIFMGWLSTKKAFHDKSPPVDDESLQQWCRRYMVEKLCLEKKKKLSKNESFEIFH